MGTNITGTIDLNYDLAKYIFGDFDKYLPSRTKVVMGEYSSSYSKPRIDRVIFNNPATIIFWKDGTKTVVKCQPGDTYDKEKGFMAAYLKKLLGNDNTFNKEINKYCEEKED